MKRVFAFLICLCMVLGMLPQTTLFTARADATYTGNLTVDSNNKGYCPVCDDTVSWTPFSGSSQMATISDGSHKHIYLTGDVSFTADNAIFKLSKSSTLCLHLNGHNISSSGYAQVATANLNVMGSGDVTFAGTAPQDKNGYWKFGFYVTGSSKINLYGGNYTLGPTAIENGIPLVHQSAGAFMAKGVTLSGPMNINGGSLTLDDTTTVSEANFSTAAKVIIKEGWSGSAKVDFAAHLDNNLVPEANATVEGAFTGTLSMTGGLTLTRTEENRLQASGFNANLVLDENNQALCPVCNTTVTWTAYSGTKALGAKQDGAHHHYYLSGNVNYTGTSNLFRLASSTKMCLHLNGYNIEHTGYIWSASGCTLNIMGYGNVTYHSFEPIENNGHWKFGLYAIGAINLYGGNYSLGETALANGVPLMYQNGGTSTIKDATLHNWVHVDGGTLKLENTAIAKNIQVATDAKLNVAANWTGDATVSFDAALQDRVVPSANGVAGGIFTGNLTLAGGTPLLPQENGTLVAEDPNKDLVLDANNRAVCPHCEKLVTWTVKTSDSNIASITDGSHKHICLGDDIEAIDISNFARLASGSQLCLHLNGHNITHGARIMLASGTTLTIMGNGNVTFTAGTTKVDSSVPDAFRHAGIVNNSGTVNLMGGTYNISDVAITENRPYVSQSGGSLTLSDAALLGPTNISGGTVTLQKSARADDLYVGTGAKMNIIAGWDGSAVVDFAAGIENNTVPAANGACEGAFKGKLTTPTGDVLKGYADGTLRRVVDLTLDKDNKAVCPICGGDPVVWTALSGADRIGSLNNTNHYHYYLSDDVNYTTITSYFALLRGGTSVCLHLNNHNLTSSSYLQISNATFNVMGTGTVTFAGFEPVEGNGYWKFGLYVTDKSAVVNLHDATFRLGQTSIDNNIPLLQQNYGTVTLNNAIMDHLVYVGGGSLTLDGNATVPELQFSTAGKLIVNETWAGLANVTFGSALVDGAVPDANGASTGSFAGGLLTSDGTLLKGEDGKLVVNDYKTLTVDANHRGYCKVCQKMVVWTPINEGENIGSHNATGGAHLHYYFNEIATAKVDQFLYLREQNDACLHLNGKTVNVPGRMQVFGATLNILGDGVVNFTASSDNEDHNLYLFYFRGNPYTFSVLNIYGGTYNIPADRKALHGAGGMTSVAQKFHLYGNTNLDGLVTITQGQLYLNEGSKVKLIEPNNNVSVRVDEDWYGTATVDYLAPINETYINRYNGRSSGNFVGGLMLDDGRRLIGESGMLRVVDAKTLRLNDEGQGYCTACNEVVSWTPISGASRIGSINNTNHYHYYLANDINYTTASYFASIRGGSQVCLHLNGHNLSSNGYVQVTASTLNILGDGNVTFNSFAPIEGNGYWKYGFYVTNSSKVNLYGGNYYLGETAVANDIPLIHILKNGSQSVSLRDVTVTGRIDVDAGSLALDGTTVADDIVVATAGRLNIADTWTGTAAAEFATGLTGKYAPAANVSMDKATGKLTLADGRALTVTEDGLAVDTVNVPANVRYKLVDDGAEILSVTGAEPFLLPTQLAGKQITSIAADAFAGFTGTLYIGAGDTFGKTYADGAGLTYTLISAINGDTGYETVEEAIGAYAGGAVQLLSDVDSITVTKDTYVDLNGYNIGDVTVTGGTLYVMDSQTDDFTVADGVYGKITGAVTGSVKAVPAEADCAQYGYLKVDQAEGISFHCVAMDVYGMTLRPDVAGIYYDSSFGGDEIVAEYVNAYGVALSVYGDPDETRKDWCYSEDFDFVAGENESGTLLQNIMTADNVALGNMVRANMPIYGRAYIKTDFGYVFGQTVCRDLQEQTELTDSSWESLTKDLRQGTRTMYETYETVMGDWTLPNADTYEDRIWFDEPAPDTGDGWEQYSLPLGNGYLGTSVFGGTESETLSFSDKSMFFPSSSASEENHQAPEGEDIMGGSSVGSNGFTNMCKLKIDFGHEFEKVTNYQRDLLLDTAEAHVTYDYEGVTYDRTYFASYPDNVTVAKLEASEAGKLSFTLRPDPTYIRDYLFLKGDGLFKTAKVVAKGDTSTLSGTLGGYNVNYEAQFKVIPVGGTMVANSDGTITVANADSAVILITTGTNYELKASTLVGTDASKLDANSFPHDKVTATMNAAAAKSYDQLFADHLADYQGIYNRVSMDLSGEPSTTVTTDLQMQAYREGHHSAFVEELLFKFGRYLLIASSRDNTLPTNLQGAWQYYASAAWKGGYVYNINLQMNYWSCYATNLVDLFDCNIDFFDAITDTLHTNADTYLSKIKVDMETAGTKKNGIAVGASGTPFLSPTVSATGTVHSGPATTAYTTSLFWEYYAFTGDTEKLEKDVWPYIYGAAVFLEKCLEPYGDKWLVTISASPENNMWFEKSFTTHGTMFDQGFIYETFRQVQQAAQILGYTADEYPILTAIEEKIDKLDHVIVGKDGHIKEYREEEYYGEFGRYEHHGMAQLINVYPAAIVTSETDAWQDAAAVTAVERGVNYTGHQSSFKQLVWARLGKPSYAYLMAQDHITNYVRDNMWNTHTPFQIDGNFGYTAGVAEMLIQSHEGYISILPALPLNWGTGSYTGLTARGGFEVDAAWVDGSATEVNIHSNKGNECSVKSYLISKATVVDSQGNPVAFTIDDQDVITFATTAGETYTITGLSKKVEVEAPANLEITPVETGSAMTWDASSDAVSYNIYRAVNSQPTYELIAEGITDTSYTYVPTDLKVGDQLILRVTAVNADDIESDGTRAITWDIVINEADATAMAAANAAYAGYTGATTEYMLYDTGSRIVVLENGVAVNAYADQAAALTNTFDDPITMEDESAGHTATATSDGWYTVS